MFDLNDDESGYVEAVKSVFGILKSKYYYNYYFIMMYNTYTLSNSDLLFVDKNLKGYLDHGDPTHICRRCKAMLWHAEAKRGNK